MEQRKLHLKTNSVSYASVVSPVQKGTDNKSVKNPLNKMWNKRQQSGRNHSWQVGPPRWMFPVSSINILCADGDFYQWKLLPCIPNSLFWIVRWPKVQYYYISIREMSKTHFLYRSSTLEYFNQLVLSAYSFKLKVLQMYKKIVITIFYKWIRRFQ